MTDNEPSGKHAFWATVALFAILATGILMFIFG